MTTLDSAVPSCVNDPAGALSAEAMGHLAEKNEQETSFRIARDAVTSRSAKEVALSRPVVTSMADTFSVRLDDWTVTNQKRSGRCWMFAALNLLRVGAMKKMNLESFEFSQNYTLFWDKLERANYFLEAIIETAGQPVDDRTVAWLLDHPLEDGGQWNMAVNVIRKHGLVPKSAMPETESSSNTGVLNANLLHRLRAGARELRDLRANGAPVEAARATKDDIMADVHRMLTIHLGTPPTSVDWQWQDKDKKFHRDGVLTPQEFAEKYVTLPLDEYVCVVHDPRPANAVGRTYTVSYLGNVVGGTPVLYLNAPIDVMKEVTRASLEDGEPVWFGCDVGKMMERDRGFWDRALYDFETLYGVEFDLDKAQRLEYHQTVMTHAMLFTGVDVVAGRPRRWRVENSWGDECGEKGFFVMNDSWFDEHMFEVAVHRDRLPEAYKAALDQEPQVLPAWDPMGALAC